MESSNYMVYRRIGRPLVKFIRVLGFLPRVVWYEVLNHQYKYLELFLDEFHVNS